MPILTESTYSPKLLFKNKHFNTIYSAFFNKTVVTFNRKRLELEDGDFMDLDISSVNSDKAVILIHGLEGSAQSSYILSLTALLNRHHYDVFAMNLRGCSGEPNRLLSSYHSGKTEDLDIIVQYIENQYIYKDINIIGFSLGGNMTLKYMGEIGINSRIKSAIGVSVPCDLKGTALKMNLMSNTLYLNNFLKTLKAKSFRKLQKFPNSFLTQKNIEAIKNFKDFDDTYTAPAHGFKNAEDYWLKSSCKQFIPNIKTPTLVLTALDDPFLTETCYPYKEAKNHEHFFLEATTYGGHVGYISSFTSKQWSENRILSFLEHQK